PTTCTEGKASCGSPSSTSNARIRSSPNSSGHGESPATQSVAERLLGDGIELASIARELLPLRLDDLWRRLRHEAVVREHLFGPGDLGKESLPLSLDVSVRLLALGLHDDVEDPLLVSLERNEDAAPAEGGRRGLQPLEHAGVGLVAGVGPGSDDQPG